MNKEKIPLTNEQEKLGLDFAEFAELFHEATITKVLESEVPRAAVEIFERKSAQFIGRDKYRPRNFECYFAINHANGDKTYLAQQTKTYNTNKDTEMLTYFVDMRGEQVLGYSELRNNTSNPDKYFKDKPFVGYTQTEQKFRRQGLGTRRLQLMNAFSETQYHLPLYSDTLNQEVGIWENFVSRGLAKKFKEGQNIRYFFIPSTGTSKNEERRFESR